MFDNPHPEKTRQNTIKTNNALLKEIVPFINDYISRPELGGNICIDLISSLLSHYGIVEVLFAINSMRFDPEKMNCATDDCDGFPEIKGRGDSFHVECEECNQDYFFLGGNICQTDLKKE